MIATKLTRHLRHINRIILIKNHNVTVSNQLFLLPIAINHISTCVHYLNNKSLNDQQQQDVANEDQLKNIIKSAIGRKSQEMLELGRKPPSLEAHILEIFKSIQESNEAQTILNYLINDKNSWQVLQEQFLDTTVEAREKQTQKHLDASKAAIKETWDSRLINALFALQSQCYLSRDYKLEAVYFNLIKALFDKIGSDNEKITFNEFYVQSIVKHIQCLMIANKHVDQKRIEDIAKSLIKPLSVLEKKAPESIRTNISLSPTNIRYIGMFFLKDTYQKAQDTFDKAVEANADLFNKIYYSSFISSFLYTNDLTRFEKTANNVAHANNYNYPAKSYLEIPHEIMHVLLKQFKSSNLTSDLNKMFKSWSVAEYIPSYHVMEEFKEWMNANSNGTLRITSTSIDKNGICKRTGNQLKNIQLTEEQRNQIRNSVTGSLFSGTEYKAVHNSKVLQLFQKFMIGRSYKVVIDGLNITLSVDDRKRRFQNVQRACSAIDTHYGKVVEKLIIFKNFTYHDRVFMDEIKRNKEIPGLDYYFSDKDYRSEDDFLLLYAAVNDFNTMILSSDYFRDHKYIVRGMGSLFKRWLDQITIKHKFHQKFKPGTSCLEIPNNYETKAQFINGVWYIPYTTRDYAEDTENRPQHYCKWQMIEI